MSETPQGLAGAYVIEHNLTTGEARVIGRLGVPEPYPTATIPTLKFGAGDE